MADLLRRLGACLARTGVRRGQLWGPRCQWRLSDLPGRLTMANVGYARVSTSGQSLDQQHDALNAASVDRIFGDVMSGERNDRPGLAAMLDYVPEGDTVTVVALDRLGRSRSGIIATIDTLQSRGVLLRSLREGIDTTSAVGRMIAGIFASLAEYETRVFGFHGGSRHTSMMLKAPTSLRDMITSGRFPIGEGDLPGRNVVPVPPLTSEGVLPHGRWRASLDEVQAAFATGKNDPRPQVWAEFVTASSTLRQIVHVCAVWLGGSYFTSKDAPDDIDCAFFVDGRSAPSSAANATAFDLFVGGRKLRQLTGLRVDSYVIPWTYRPGVELEASSQIPLMWRGYWDDLWQRHRHGAKGATHPADAVPERGYLEVILDGFPTAATA